MNLAFLIMKERINFMKVRDIDSLMSIIESKKPDAIVVEGYDGVGDENEVGQHVESQRIDAEDMEELGDAAAVMALVNKPDHQGKQRTGDATSDHSKRRCPQLLADRAEIS